MPKYSCVTKLWSITHNAVKVVQRILSGRKWSSQCDAVNRVTP